MGGYVYCLYSTADGEPRYVGRSSDKVSYRFKQHVTLALDKAPGDLYDWIRDTWRHDHDVSVYILQDAIAPKDLDFFERYWIAQFTNLLNVTGNTKTAADTEVGRDIKSALKQQLREARRYR